MTATALRLSPWLLALARASVSDTVLGGRALPAPAQQPAADEPTAGDVAGASFVLCRGQQLCSGEETNADGARMCAGGLYCKDWALVVALADNARLPEMKDQMKAAVAVGAEASEGARETQEDSAAAQAFAAENVNASSAGALKSAERLYYCPGGYGCSHWGWHYGHSYCDGGYHCMGWGNGWHGGHDDWHGGHDDWHGGHDDWHGGHDDWHGGHEEWHGGGDWHGPGH